MRTSLIERTADIVAAFVEHNRVETGALPNLIASAHGALVGLGAFTMHPAIALPVRAMTAQKSLADPKRIVSMIDGKPYRMLARHLRAHGLTPAEYRTRFGLPASYPKIAPAHAEKRRALAKAGALGRKPKGSHLPRRRFPNWKRALPNSKDGLDKRSHDVLARCPCIGTDIGFARPDDVILSRKLSWTFCGRGHFRPFRAPFPFAMVPQVPG